MALFDKAVSHVLSRPDFCCFQIYSVLNAKTQLCQSV